MNETNSANGTKKSPFRWLLWSLAVLGVLGAIAAIWIALVINNFMERRPPATVAAAPGDEFEVSSIGTLKGTPWIVIYIGKADGSDVIYSGKGGYSRNRNVLLMNRDSGDARPILPDNSRPIADIQFLPAAPSDPRNDNESSSNPPRAYYVIQLARKSTEAAPLDLLVGTLATRKQAVIMSGISGVDEMWMMDNNRLALIVRENKALYYRIVDVPNLKLLLSRKIKIG